MPGFITHYLSGQTALSKLHADIKAPILTDEKLFNLGTMGPDFFFYDFPRAAFGQTMHENGLAMFLTALPDLGDNKLTFAYTSGFILHYCLDVAAHPYVYAKTHDASLPKRKNSAIHRNFETNLDIALLKTLQDKPPSHLDQKAVINSENTMAAAEATAQAIQAAYGKKMSKKTVHHAMQHMIFLTGLLRSKKGRRKRVLRFIEMLTIRASLFSSMVHSEETDGADYMNTAEADWLAPWEGAATKNTSFINLYNSGVAEAMNIITDLYNYMFLGMDKTPYIKALGNRSLRTGQTCTI